MFAKIPKCKIIYLPELEDAHEHTRMTLYIFYFRILNLDDTALVLKQANELFPELTTEYKNRNDQY